MDLERYNIKNFEDKLKEILQYIRRYAIDKMSGIDLKKSSDVDIFIALVHKGFALAQEEIIKLLLLIDEINVRLNKELKEANITKNKDRVKKLKSIKTKLEYQEVIVRKLADSIAWQLAHCEHHTLRRLYLGEKTYSIRSSNLEYGLKVIRKFNEEHPKGFALISDITSFIQIGDLLIVDLKKDGSSIGICELKEGKENEHIRGFLDFLYTAKCDRALYLFAKEEGITKYEQLKRMAKQDLRMMQSIDIINNGRGLDPATNKNVIISDDVFTLEHFDHIVSSLLTKSEEKGWAIDIVDECLFIGVYSGKFPGNKAFRGWLEPFKITYPRIDFRNSFFVPLSLPPFLLPFSEKDLMHLVSGDKRILMCLDYDKWFEIGKKFGLESRWLSRKETGKLLYSCRPFKPFTYENKAIEFSIGEVSGNLYDGILGRIFYELVTPSSAIKFIKHGLEHEL